MATNDDLSKDPSQPSDAYNQMAPRWELINALLGGTEAMRRAGETYLPRHEEETDLSYADRLASAVLLNMTERTLDTLVGKPFSSPDPNKEALQLVDVLEPIVPLLNDIDLQGNNLTVFARNWFREGLAKSFSHVLVEYPRKPNSTATMSETLTLADQVKAQLRPYWVAISPEQLIAARFEKIGGALLPVHVRIVESRTVSNGFQEVQEQLIRVLEPGRVKIYRPMRTRRGKVEWIMDDEWSTGLSVIPLVTFYSNKIGPMLGKPALLDLAEQNKAHWQSYSDQRHALTVARFPILACSGSSGPNSGDNSDDITIGPNKVLYSTDPAGRYYYVEHSGSAIEAGRKELMDLEDQMASYGAQFLRKRSGGETATAKAIDTAESSSILSSMVVMFCDAVAQALSFTAEWMKLPTTAGTITLNTSWSDTEDLGTSMDVVKEARKNKEISRKSFLAILKYHNVLPDIFDVEEDTAALIEEQWKMLTPAELQQLLATSQGKYLSFTETRAVLRKMGWATQKDETAKDEIESTLDFGVGAPTETPIPPKEENPEPPIKQPTPPITPKA